MLYKTKLVVVNKPETPAECPFCDVPGAHFKTYESEDNIYSYPNCMLLTSKEPPGYREVYHSGECNTTCVLATRGYCPFMLELRR